MMSAERSPMDADLNPGWEKVKKAMGVVPPEPKPVSAAVPSPAPGGVPSPPVEVPSYLTKPEPSVYVEPARNLPPPSSSRFEQSREAPVATPKPPKVDPAQIGAGLTRRGRLSAEQAGIQEYQHLAQRAIQVEGALSQIPHQTEEQRSDLSEDQKVQLNQLYAEKQQLQRRAQTELPREVESNKRLSDMESNLILSIQEEVAVEHPQYASRVLDMAAGLPTTQQANRQTYRMLLAQAIGEDSLDKYDNERIVKANVGTTLASSRGGGDATRRREVTSDDVDKAVRMGFKGDALKNFLKRLEGY